MNCFNVFVPMVKGEGVCPHEGVFPHPGEGIFSRVFLGLSGIWNGAFVFEQLLSTGKNKNRSSLKHSYFFRFL